MGGLRPVGQRPLRGPRCEQPDQNLHWIQAEANVSEDDLSSRPDHSHR